MEINVFEKRVQPRNGAKAFYKLITRMEGKDGRVVYADVRFGRDAKAPESYPVTLVVNKGDANLTATTVYKGTEREREVHTLWVKKYVEKAYIDHSLDDFD